MQAILIGVKYSGMTYDVDASLEELEALCSACDIEVSHTVIQKIDKIHPNTCIGKGKLEEVKGMVTSDMMVIFDEELTPLQVRNITDALDTEVTDRTDIILRIFESRAKTKEAKLQVEIAKAQYLLPRLAGMHEHISHQQGGSGFRGSGEKQIEIDRRKLHRELFKAKQELAEIVKQRQNQRRKRKATGMKVIALVGYTNSGKSTLMNTFALDKEKKVFQKDMLFATLETATRRVNINNHPCLLTDTVGFIDRLPHQLIHAFRSTLEEVIEADVLVHVVDSSNAEYEQYVDTTNRVLESLGVKDIPVIYAYNKVDLNQYAFVQPRDPYVFISAKEGTNLDTLEKRIGQVLFKDYAVYELNIPYENGEVFQDLEQHCQIKEQQYLDTSIYVIVEAHPSYIHKYNEYMLKH